MTITELCTIVNEALNLKTPTIKPSSKAGHITGAWDSLGSILIVMAVERAFNVKVPDGEVFLSVKEIVDYLRAKGINIDD